MTKSNEGSGVDTPRYPETCPVCGREALGEHLGNDGLDFRTCRADPDERHQWREDGAIWSDRRKEWVNADEHDVWDTQDPDAPYSGVFSSVE